MKYIVSVFDGLKVLIAVFFALILLILWAIMATIGLAISAITNYREKYKTLKKILLAVNGKEVLCDGKKYLITGAGFESSDGETVFKIYAKEQTPPHLEIALTLEQALNALHCTIPEKRWIKNNLRELPFLNIATI